MGDEMEAAAVRVAKKIFPRILADAKRRTDLEVLLIEFANQIRSASEDYVDSRMGR